MPRAPSERPSRRLDAILETLRRHGVRRFKALKLDGIGEGLEWSFEPLPPARAGAAPRRSLSPVDRDLDADVPGEPMDELDLVAEGREGPVPGNGVS